MERQESHMLWNNLMEHMVNDNCPVCSLMKERNHSAMDNFLYECANLPDIRLKIKKEGGFCERHSKELREFGDPLAHAILYQDLFDEAFQELNQTFLPKKITFLGKKESQKNNCFFCRKEKTGEEHYTKAMANAVSNAKFLETYTQKGMLCLPHLKMALSSKTKDQEKVKQLKQITWNKYNKIWDSLKEIVRKHDFHYTNEPLTEQEKKDWKRAVDIFNSLEKEQV